MEKVYLNGDDWEFKEFVGMDWVWRNSVKPKTKDVRWWYRGTVPGSVLHDLSENNLVPDPYYELNSKLVEWVPARTWVYRKKFFVPVEWRGRKVQICFEGIDYEAIIFLNGEQLESHKGMFIPWKDEIGSRLLYGEENLVAVVILPAPFEQPQVGKTSLVSTHKSRMTYWWDFCPRMIHQGIWDDVYLKITEDAVIEDVYITSELSENYSKARVVVEVQVSGDSAGSIVVSLDGQTRKKVVSGGKSRVEFWLEQPELWWPNGYGSQYQYNVKVILEDNKGKESDCYEKKYGIRSIKFEKNDGADENAPRFVLAVNGKRIYMKGYNWVPADVMYGVNRPEKIRHLLRLAREAHTNIFRIWGGGLIEKDSFYEACAENGILIWQEFILSSSGIDNKTSHDNAYCEMMKEQSEIIIKRKRNHTALAVWCGGNELQEDDGKPLDNEDILISILKKNVEYFDPGRKWLPTSPSGGVFLNSVENILKYPDKLYDVHGPWEHQGMEKQYALYNMGTSLLHTEFGVEGMTNRETLLRTVAENHLLPAGKDNEVYFHRGAWWNNEPLVQEMFGGNLEDIDKIRKASQFMQYEGLKYAVECNRRRTANSGSFPWQFNEPYPNNYCTSHIDYYSAPKPVYYGIKKAYAPITVTAAFETPCFHDRDFFMADVYLGSERGTEGMAEIGMADVTARMIALDGTVFHVLRFTAEFGKEECRFMGTIRFKADDIPDDLFLLRLQVVSGDRVLAENEYLFTGRPNYSQLFEIEEPDLLVSGGQNQIIIKNNGDVTAYFVNISEIKQSFYKNQVYLEQNYCCILPGEVKVISMTGGEDEWADNCFAIEGMNVPYREIQIRDKAGE